MFVFSNSEYARKVNHVSLSWPIGGSKPPETDFYSLAIQGYA